MLPSLVIPMEHARAINLWYIWLHLMPVMEGADVKRKLEDIIMRLNKLEVQSDVLEFVRRVKEMAQYKHPVELDDSTFKNSCVDALKIIFQDIRTGVSNDVNLLQLIVVHFQGTLGGQTIEYFFISLYPMLIAITHL